MKKKTEEKMLKAIEENPLVSFTFSFGFAKIPKASQAKAILNYFRNPGDAEVAKETVDAAIQEATNTLNTLNQAGIALGKLSGVRAFASGATMLSVKDSLIGNAMAAKMRHTAELAKREVLAGKDPEILYAFDTTGNRKRHWEVMKLTIKALDVSLAEGEKRTRENVEALLERQIKINADIHAENAKKAKDKKEEKALAA